MKKSIVFAAVIAMVASISALPAAANSPTTTATTSSTVNVTLRLSVGEPAVSPQYKACGVTVSAGADGSAVLQAAKNSGCISSYQTTTYPGNGTFVDCLDGICGAVVTYWRMTENGALTTFGVDGFQANAGDVLGFSYTQWATCVAEPSLC